MHWYAGRPKNEMAQSLGVDRKTLRKYIAPAEAAGIRPGGPARSEQEWAELVRGWFPQLADARRFHVASAGQVRLSARRTTYAMTTHDIGVPRCHFPTAGQAPTPPGRLRVPVRLERLDPSSPHNGRCSFRLQAFWH